MTAGELLRSLVRRSSLATSPNATIHHLITYNIVPKDTSVHLKKQTLTKFNIFITIQLKNKFITDAR